MRPFHSPSSIAIRCDRAWALRYIAKIRDPEPEWQAFADGTWECPHPASGPHVILRRDGKRTCRLCARIRAAALGTAMHSVGEQWYRGDESDWSSLPGQVFLSGSHLLPHPTRLLAADVELQIGLPWADLAWGPGSALMVHGIRWVGKIDLSVVVEPEELARLGIDRLDIIDYKSSCSIAKYAKDADALRADGAANLYALADMTESGHDVAHCRWVYFETREVRRSHAVDFTITRGAALEALAPMADLARRLDAITSVEDAEPNLDACQDFGGCPHHNSCGGPCDARRSLGATIAAAARARKKGTYIMPLDSKQKAELDARLAARKVAPAAPAGAEAEAPAASVEAEAPPPPRRGRPPGAKAKPVASVDTTPPATDAFGAIQALVAERDAAYTKASELDAKLAGLRDALTAAIGGEA